MSEALGAELLTEQPEVQQEVAAQPAATEQPAPQAAPAWIDQIDPEWRDSIAARGLKDTNTLAKSYHHLVRLHGKNPHVVAIPDDASNDEQRAEFYKAIGVPESPDKYEINVPEGIEKDEEFLNGYKGVAHKLGLTPAQVKGVADYYHEKIGGKQEASAAQVRAQQENDLQSLKQEWGSAYDSKLSQGRAAVAQLGIDDQLLGQLELALGTKGVITFFQNIGSKIGEDKFVSGDGHQRFNGELSPTEARAQIAQLDRDFRASLLDVRHPQHQANMAKWKELNRMAG